MTPDEKIALLEVQVAELSSKVNQFIYPDRYLFPRKVEIFDGQNIALGVGTGTKIGTATTQKLAFFNATPVVQQAAITSPSGGATIDTQARTAIDTIRTRLASYGLTP